MHRTVTFSLLLCVLSASPCFAAGGSVKRPARARSTELTDAQVTGTYEAGKWGTLDVAAARGVIRVHLVALAGLNRPGGPNIGEVDTTLLLDQNLAVYAPPDEQGRLILRFAPSYVEVTQIVGSWDVGFGMGVNAGGRYRKISSKNPHLGPMPKQGSEN